ncbi:heptosyltransferase [Mannheimia granulomatis]|uniref:glycosyltransferase family 9 protein n=1 Tax=Mannheimia granulomatis TaxID=85402 RepID=UPI00159E7ED0|nr:glycosyltransferase family 9 protein [Mannheimia granulomatis]QLB14465.1 heptosyltransferase [Mannheimia granulomatis]
MKIKLFLQKIRLFLGKYILDRKSDYKSLVISPEKILFLRQDGKIGDYIVSSFVFRELKKQNNDLTIGIVCTKKDAYLYKKNPYIDHIYYVKKRNILDYIKCGIRLSKEKYDIVVDPTILIRNRDLLLLRLINAKYYIGYQKESYQLFNINIKTPQHFSEIYKTALEMVGFKVDDDSYDIPFDQTSQDEIMTYLDKNEIRNYIAINFFGAANSRKVSYDNIIRYIEYLKKIIPSKPLILLSYPDVFEELSSISEKYQGVYVPPTKTIFNTIELIRTAEVIISPDTATVHIASGLNKKIIALYGDGIENFTHWRPLNKSETHVLFYKENINEISPEQIKPEWLVD